MKVAIKFYLALLPKLQNNTQVLASLKRLAQLYYSAQPYGLKLGILIGVSKRPGAAAGTSFAGAGTTVEASGFRPDPPWLRALLMAPKPHPC